MAETTSSLEEKHKVWELIKDIKIALLVTTGEGGHMRGRPMAALNKAFDGDLWFASREAAPKLEEIAGNTHVLLAYSEPKNQNYVSVSGHAHVVRDTAKMKELWSEGLRIWFPKGPENAEMALIRVEVDSAEYWDSPSSAWVFAYGYAKARMTGEPPKGMGENKVVNF